MLPQRSIIFLGLNTVRFLSLVSLILVFSSTIFVMVTNIKAVNAFDANKSNGTEDMLDCDYIDGSTVPNQPAGVFWAIVASLLIIFQTIILFFSEVGWPLSFFDHYFPVLGSNFGLGALGIFQCLISTQILSHHVDDFTLVAAFFLFALGCLNMLLGLIFRESAKERRSITSWRSEAKGILPTTSAASGNDRGRAGFISSSFVSSTYSREKVPQPGEFGVWRSESAKKGYGFGRQGEKAAGLRGFILQKPDETLPRYASPAPRSPPQLNRKISSVSSTSSFASPRPHRETIMSDDENDDNDNEDVSTPRFKSSPTAI